METPTETASRNSSCNRATPMGEAYAKQAEARFLDVQEAYESLKKIRGFK